VRHGDPNPKNILFCKGGKVKFIDLGPSVESPVRLYADVFALLAYSDWYAAFCGVDEYYELVSQRLTYMTRAPGFPWRDFNLLFHEKSDEAVYLNYMKQLYLQHGEIVIGTLEILKKNLDKQRTKYLEENSFTTWTYTQIWNPAVLRASAQACNEQRLYYSTLDLLLEKLQKIEGVEIKAALNTYAKSPEAIRSDEKRDRRFVLTVPARSDPSSNKRAASHLTSVQRTLQTLLQEYGHKEGNRIKKDIIRRLEGITKPCKDEIIEEIIKDEWKVEVATAFVSFIQEYQKLRDTQDRYKVDLRANDWKWKKLAFANFYVRRYQPLYLDV
jgi:serine/threonine protein kinase